jgi:hypothetical protein
VTPRRFGRSLFLIALAWHGWAGANSEAFGRAAKALDDGDCNRVRELVNAGLNEGDKDIYFLAGAMLARGLCVKVDGQRAVQLLETAVKAAQEEAAVELIQLHGTGRSVPQSYAEAGRWTDAWGRYHASKVTRPAAASAPKEPATMTVEYATTLGYLGTIHALATQEIRTRRYELLRLAPQGRAALVVALSMPDTSLRVGLQPAVRDEQREKYYSALIEAVTQIYRNAMRTVAVRPCPESCVALEMQVPYGFKLD